MSKKNKQMKKENINKKGINKESVNKVEDDKSADKDIIKEEVKGKNNKVEDKPQLSDFMGNSNEIFSTNKQKYESTMSSAIILLIFGCGGMFVEILAILGVIYLPIMKFQYVLMFVVFLFFIVSGAFSYHKAKSYVVGMNEEDDQRNKVNYFLNDLLTDQVLKELKSDELSEEENYVCIIDKLKEMILEKYPEYNKELLEYMIDDYLNEHF